MSSPETRLQSVKGDDIVIVVIVAVIVEIMDTCFRDLCDEEKPNDITRGNKLVN